MHDKKGALDSLAKHLGMFGDEEGDVLDGEVVETVWTVDLDTTRRLRERSASE